MVKENIITKQKLMEFPKEVINEVKKTLKCYDRCYIEFERGQYWVNTFVAVCGKYPEDHKFIGEVYAKDIYTPEERNKNYRETFGYDPYPKYV